MRFADQRAQARAAIVTSLPKSFKDKEEYARRVVLRANKYPRPVPVANIEYPTGKARTERRNLGLRKPRKRIRGTIPPHPIAVINEAHRRQRNCIHAQTYEDNGLIYCSECHLEQPND